MDEVSRIREKTDLVSLISEYIPLKKMGRNFKAACPFHNEKTPSFVVSPERQIWHCFGCGKGGDCYSFLMEYENLEFPEALRILAKKTGIELKRSLDFQTGLSFKKEQIYKLNRLALEFYHYLLTHHNVGKKALEYLGKQRKINPSMIELFKIGFSPRLGNSLATYLTGKKGYKKEDLIDAGLAVFRPGGVMDFFSNRIIFPLFDHRDNAIGFSGRVMDQGAEASKYINTKETLIYHKGSTFFGLNQAKDEIKREEWAIIMEGEFDVISAIQAGIKNTVAIKGTALTEDQAQLISRFAKRVSLSFDQDQAGLEALKRSLSFLEKKGLSTFVIVPPNGKDPDESIKKDPSSFKKAVRSSIGVYDYLLSNTLGSYDKKNAESKKKIAKELLPLFAQIDNEIVKEHYLKKLSGELETSYESITKEVEKLKKEEKPVKTPGEKEKKQREEVLEEYLLSLILQSENPQALLGNSKTVLGDLMFSTPSYQKIKDLLLSSFEKTNDFNSKKFSQTLAAELLPAFDTCFLFPLPKFPDDESYREEIIKMAKDLKTLVLRRKIKEIGEKIGANEKNGEDKHTKELKKEFSSLIVLLKKSEK